MKIKGFDKDLCCTVNGIKTQYEIGKTYDTGAKDSEIKLRTNTVFHYCDSIQKVHRFYSVDSDNRFCEIKVIGAEISDVEKCGSNKIKIIREIIGDELDILVGKINKNSGIFNSGIFNSGDRNSGDRNSGNCNSGDCNSGNCNSGLFNSCDNSNGVFCTEEPKISTFNIQTDMTLLEFRESQYYTAICSSPFILTEYMDEKIITHTYKEACKIWWENMSDKYKHIIMSIPNFDNAIFEEITGIKL